MKIVKTFTATIYVGFREGRGSDPPVVIHGISEVLAVAQEYCDQVGLCVTVTQTQYIYTSGREAGCAVGLINYPRFPSTPEQIRAHALELAGRLRDRLGQFKVSVVMPDETVMIGEDAH